MSRNMNIDGYGAVPGVRRRLAILTVAVCVMVSGTASGCGVRQGEENIQKAKQAKKQVEGVQHKLQKDLNKGGGY